MGGPGPVSRLGLVVRRSAGTEADGRRFSRLPRLTFLSELKTCDQLMDTVSRDFALCTINETAKWLTSLAHLNAAGNHAGRIR